jgi:cell division protein ZipA
MTNQDGVFLMLWVILFIVVFILIIGFFIFKYKKQKAYLAEQKEEPVFTNFDADAKEETEYEYESLEEPIEAELSEAELEDDPAKEAKENVSPHELIVMRLIASKNRPYKGYELLQALLANGFRYGRMNIFHRHEKKNGEGSVLFSLASATEPGTFDIHNMGNCTCQGLTLFMCIDDHKKPSSVFEIMLDVAKQLLDDLGGEIRDERHLLLDQSVIEKWRKRINNYEDSLYTYDLFEGIN